MPTGVGGGGFSGGGFGGGGGGGGFSAGGFGGGGSGGGMHMHRHKHSSSSGNQFCCSLVGFVIFVVVMIIVVVVLVSQSQHSSAPPHNSIIAAPQEYRILSYDQSNCDVITISTSQYQYSVQLYLMSREPAVADGATIQISESWYTEENDEFKYDYFYLLNSSSISITLLTDEYDLDMYIQSSSQFQPSYIDPSDTLYSATCGSISSPCEYSYTVEGDDEYYILFQQDQISYFHNVSYYLTIHAKKYVIESSDIHENCTANCSLSVLDTPTLYPVVITGDVIDADWTASVPYTWHCTMPSGFTIPVWVYVSVAIVGAIVAPFIVGFIATAVLCKKKSKQQQRGEPLLPISPEAPSTTSPSSYQPPPVVHSSPSHQPVQTTYVHTQVSAVVINREV